MADSSSWSEPGTYKQEIVLRFTANQTAAVVNLSRRLEGVVRLDVIEYAINTPGAVGTWRLDLTHNGIEDFQQSNVAGNGLIFTVDNTTFAHQQYNVPRTVSVSKKGFLNSLDAKLIRINGAAVADPTFTEAVFYLIVVMKDPQWKPRDEGRQIDMPSLQFSHRNDSFFYKQ